jgi:hypothetical protein
MTMETRHHHGDMEHDHFGGHVEHDHWWDKERKPPNYGKNIFWLLVCLLLLYVLFHVAHAEMTRSNPPLCLLGAHWNIWSGWACN